MGGEAFDGAATARGGVIFSCNNLFASFAVFLFPFFFSVPPLKLLLSISPSHLEKAATEPNGKGEEKCIDDEDENEGTDQKEGPEPLTGTFHNMYH